MKIAAFAQDRGACTGYRIGQPAGKIRKLGTTEIYTIGLADPKTDEAVESADIIFLGRAGDVKALDMVKRLKGMGKKVVYDLDDSLFDISPFSPHYGQLGIMPVNVEPGGGVDKFDFWVPGEKGFDVSRNRHIRKYFIQIIRAVDAVTVTTPPLQKLYRRYNDNVYIVPNAIDFDIWRWNGVQHKSGNVRVAYAAGSNHQEDWFFVKSVLERVMKEIPGWTLVLMGVDWKGQWGSLDPKRVETTPWVDFECHPLAMALSCADIGLAPIAKIEFNDCRSSIKWAEYTAIGAATIATDYGPYLRDCNHGADALLCDSKKDWEESLTTLILDADRRKKLASNALKKVKRDYNLDFVADSWLNVFKEVYEK